MEDKEMLAAIKYVLTMAFKTITPWKKSVFTESRTGSAAEYVAGWNDCLKEIKKNRAGYLKKLDELKTKNPIN